MLMNLELMKAGFPVAVIPVEERVLYYMNFACIATHGDYTPFVEEVGKIVEQSLKHYWFVLDLTE